MMLRSAMVVVELTQTVQESVEELTVKPTWLSSVWHHHTHSPNDDTSAANATTVRDVAAGSDVLTGSGLKHAHWNGFDPVPRWQHLVIGAYVLVMGVIAVVGNMLVVWACMRYRSLRTPSNLLVVNLAIGDLLMCLVDFPLFVSASFLQYWPFGKTVCQTYGAMTAAAGLVTINTLAVISLDRHRAVTRLLTPTHPRSFRATFLAALGVWLYSVPWALAPVLGWGDYVLDGIGTTCTFDFLTQTPINVAFVMSVTVANFVMPLSVIIFSYSQIWFAIRASRHTLQRHNSIVVSVGTRRRKRMARFQEDLKTAAIILSIVMMFLVSWTPYLIVCMLGLFGDRARVTVMTSLLPSLVAKTSTAFNPVLYSISHPKVRHKLRSLFAGRSMQSFLLSTGNYSASSASRLV